MHFVAPAYPSYTCKSNPQCALKAWSFTSATFTVALQNCLSERKQQEKGKSFACLRPGKLQHRTQQACSDSHRARGTAVTAATQLERDAESGSAARLMEMRSLCAALLMYNLALSQKHSLSLLQ